MRHEVQRDMRRKAPATGNDDRRQTTRNATRHAGLFGNRPRSHADPRSRGSATSWRCSGVELPRARDSLRAHMPEHHDTADTIAGWLEERTGREVHFEKVEAGDEQVLPGREQRELDRASAFSTQPQGEHVTSVKHPKASSPETARQATCGSRSAMSRGSSSRRTRSSGVSGVRLRLGSVAVPRDRGT